MQKNSKWLIFTAVSIVAVIINLDMTAVNLALVAIGKDFHATLSQLQWVVNIYMLTNIIFIVFVGRVADIITKKPVYLTGVVIFLFASIIAGFSSNLSTLILGRAIQGIGFACTLTLGIIIATQAFSTERRGFVLGCYMTVVGLAQAFGPTIGGVFIQYLSWRAIFLINIPLALIALIFITKFYPKGAPNPDNKKIPAFDVTILGLGLSLFMFALNKLGEWGFSSILFIGSLLISLVFLIIFYKKEQKTKNPLINFNIFHNKNYLVINIIRWIFMFNWMSLVFSLPLYLQNIIGMNSFHAGLAIFCMTLVSGAIAPILGIWLDRIGFKIPTLISIFLSLLTFLLFVSLNETFSLPILITGLVLMGISAPIMGSASAAIAMRSLPENSMGVGMGAFYTIAFLGSAVGVAISGSLISLATINYSFIFGLKIVMWLNALLAAFSLGLYFTVSKLRNTSLN